MYAVRKITTNDLDKILEILNSVLLSNVPSKDNGFLSSNPGRDFYKNLIEKTNFFYVAQDKNDVIGFLIAYPNDLLNQENDIQKFLSNNYKEKFVYIFQIAVSPGYQSQGVGQELYKKLFEETKNIKKMIVTSAVPYNQASEKFHLKLGFKKIGKILRNDGGSNFIYENTN